jgi:hypothetical protein
MLSVVCEFCGEKVRRGRIGEHQRLVHPWRKEVISGSISFDDCREEESLRRKLKQALGTTISIESRTDWGLFRVPILRSEGPWADNHQDIYWRAFISFCRWPSRKEHARLEAHDSIPGSRDAKRLVLFFRGDLRRLSISARIENKPHARNKVVEGVTLHELARIDTLEDVLLM